MALPAASSSSKTSITSTTAAGGPRLLVLLSVLAICAVLSTRTSLQPLQLQERQQLQQQQPRRSFTDLLIESGSDKYHRHHYEQYYERWLAEYRSKPGLRFLEIGARDGKSMKLWDSYFDDGTTESILGLGYDHGTDTTKGLEERAESLEKVTVVFGDQSKVETMDML